jgi:hypothetical protein
VSDADRALAPEKISVLLETVNRAVLLDVAMDNGGSVNLNPYALADILASLAKLGDSQGLANHLCNLMERYENKLVRTLGPQRLVERVESLATLQLHSATLIGRMCERLKQGNALGNLDVCHLSPGLKSVVVFVHLQNKGLVKGLLKRLCKQIVHQKATVADICQALYAAQRLICIIDESDETLYQYTNIVVHTLLQEVHHPAVNTTFSCSLMAGQAAKI